MLAIISPAAIPADQQAQLAAYEAVIARSLTSYREAGAGLAAIRKAQLYLPAYPSFTAYCRRRWSMTRRYACRLIQAAAVADTLKAANLPIPLYEHTCRPLALLPAREACQVWRHALAHVASDRQPTSALVAGLTARAQLAPPAAAIAALALSPRARAVGLLLAALERARRLLAGIPGSDGRHLAEVLDHAAELASRLTG